MRDNTDTDCLVDTEWLQKHLEDPAVRVVEVDVSPAAYKEGHVPGAVLWNVYKDLKDPNYKPRDREAIERIFNASGITRESIVVFYGYGPAMGFWLMRLPSASHRWAMRMLLDSLALLLGTRLSVVLSAEAEESFWMQDLSDGFGFGIDSICYEVEVVESRKRRPRHRLRLVPWPSEESER
jgi:hypothetical protein